MVEKPELTDELKSHLESEALKNPSGWVYQIDGDFGPDDDVPPEAIIGAWSVDDCGHLTGEYKANPNYRPVNSRT